MPEIPTIALPGGEPMPVLGLGTWGMGDDDRRAGQEADALRNGLDLGIRLIDTAEMYANGRAEQITGEAMKGRRDDVFLVSKVLPGNASREGTIAACERSLKHLGTDRIDLYLLHWRGPHPLEETLAGFEALMQAGKIRHWGVSNFDMDDCRELEKLAPGKVATNQLLYNLMRRGIEYDLLPWSRERGVPVMAYSPIEQGRLLKYPALGKVAERYGATPAQIALSWLLRQPGIVAIPKAARTAHVEENLAALDIRLDSEDLAILDRAFPPPASARPLEML
ncbi:aldo/keto reductase [Oceanibaculum indicum]|uniref:Oxidoreductase n=1 Tax=Oceanibaculum indicum P24 TaxID=1207063 RepID=K2JM67_9PROT|nr:aldo/keto reductase [Oceanibaculum indicum]EKE71589.1 oxidoreductase [Oceanibaculum indicum P24]